MQIHNDFMQQFVEMITGKSNYAELKIEITKKRLIQEFDDSR